ncbi:hypothetical protein D9M72_246520 [compost metagenome]
MIWTSAESLKRSRAAATASKRSSPQSESTCANVRTRVVPRATIIPSAVAARSMMGVSARRQLLRSFSIMVHTPGPPVCSRNGRPSRLESRCTWTSENAGSSSRPRPSTMVAPGPVAAAVPRPADGAAPCTGSRSGRWGTTAAITPPSSVTSERSPPQGRTSRIRVFAGLLVAIVPAYCRARHRTASCSGAGSRGTIGL